LHGEYDQQLYYLPFALTHLKDSPSDGIEFVAGLVYFIAAKRDRLEKDGYFHAVLDELRTSFRNWTAQFRVIHFDAAACAAKGWRRHHDDYVENSDAVGELIDALLRYGLAALAAELVESWTVIRRSREEAAWLLEYAKAQREGYAYYLGDKATPKGFDMTPTKRSKNIGAIVRNDLLLQSTYEEIKDSVVAAESSPTYWIDLVTSLGLTA
jgi:hypothetical protein